MPGKALPETFRGPIPEAWRGEKADCHPGRVAVFVAHGRRLYCRQCAGDEEATPGTVPQAATQPVPSGLDTRAGARGPRPAAGDLSPQAQAMRPRVGDAAEVDAAEVHALAKAAARALSVLATLNATHAKALRDHVGADLAGQAEHAQRALWEATGPFRDRAGRIADGLTLRGA